MKEFAGARFEPSRPFGALHAIAEGERGLTSQLTVTVLAAVVGNSSPLICRLPRPV
jgi:hypothetical protein